MHYNHKPKKAKWRGDHEQTPQGYRNSYIHRASDERLEQGLQRGLVLMKKNKLSNDFQREGKSWPNTSHILR